MASGGARSRSGPPRQRDAVRHGRGGDSGWSALPAEGRAGDTPAWPFPRPSRFELDTWEREWRRPQAIAWERLGWEVQVALYVRTLKAASGAKATAGNTTNLLRQMENLGLTEAGMSRNRWYIVEGAAPSAPKRQAGATAKDRMKVIQGGADAAAS